MPRSRTVALISTSAAICTLVPIALYQCGVTRKLPDPPSSLFASERITSSDDAHPIGIPDSLPGLLSYSTTLVLLLTARKSRKARWLLQRKLILDGSLASFNVVKQVFKFHALCSWCTGTALATTGIVLGGRRYARRLQQVGR